MAAVHARNRGLRILTAALWLALAGSAVAHAQRFLVPPDSIHIEPPTFPPLADIRDVTVDLVRSYAEPFIASQNTDGSYILPPNVQTHMKAIIGMVLASRTTGDMRYAESARRNLVWVIRNRMEPNGGINWTGPQNPFFFEVHQHWFLIASEMVRETLGGPDSLRAVQRRAWLYLLQNNPAAGDFYYHNLVHHGAFFAYRSVDRDGRFQTQAPFKGSYEVGAALWSLALHRGHSWLDVGPGGIPGHTVDEYLGRLVTQAQLPPGQKGYFDAERGVWIRSLLWNGLDWSGWETHDIKYALHTAEGALLYSSLSGRRDLLDEERRDIEDLLARVAADGSIRGIPDGNGTPAYEYGEALSVLGLGAQAAWVPVPRIGNRCLEAGRRAAVFAAQMYTPSVAEDRAILLAGLCRVLAAMNNGRTFVTGEERNPIVAPTVTLSAWPNPMSDHVTIRYSIPPGDHRILRIIDTTGRVVALARMESTGSPGLFKWNGRDARGRELPVGQYRAILEDDRTAGSVGITILR
jgi:hypothetical protein